MNGGLSILRAGEQRKGPRGGKLKILVYNYPFPSQAIFHGDLRIVRTGENFFAGWIYRTQADLWRNLRSGMTQSNPLCRRIHGRDLRQ